MSEFGAVRAKQEEMKHLNRLLGDVLLVTSRYGFQEVSERLDLL